MMRLRVVAPPASADQVTDLLRAHDGVVHVTATGTATAGEPRVVEATVVRQAADDVVDRLTDLGVDRDGEIALTPVELLVSRAADEAARQSGGDADDAVIWDEVIDQTGDDSRLTPAFFAFITIACLLAAVGVLTGSAVTIVGAMVVSPDFGPVAALAVAAVTGRAALSRQAVVALVGGFGGAVAVTALAGVLLRLTGLWDPGELVDLGDVAFVYEVGPYSVIVAVLAGVAGMLALTAAKSGTLLGVFISVTTIPAAGFAAPAAVAGDWSRCLEALAMLGINVVGVALAAVVTLWLRREHVTLGAHRRSAHRRSSARGHQG